MIWISTEIVFWLKQIVSDVLLFSFDKYLTNDEEEDRNNTTKLFDEKIRLKFVWQTDTNAWRVWHENVGSTDENKTGRTASWLLSKLLKNWPQTAAPLP